MPRLIGSPERVEAMGNRQKLCDEYFGLVNTGDSRVSITLMHSPAGWEGPAHHASFHQYAVVFSGVLRVEYEGGVLEVGATQSVHVMPGEVVLFSTPGAEGCEYLSVCVPAYSRADVHVAA
jgi:quercetin dioxygenase-like cupin family protein